MRHLSHSEAETLYDCGLKHDLRYIGQSLGGQVVKSRFKHYYLQRGTAWGIAVQVWHASGDLASAEILMLESLEQDAETQRAQGVYLAEEHAELHDLLLACLRHYALTMPRLRLAEPEKKLLVKIPGLRGWRFDMRLDGVATVDGEDYPFESKIRNQLTSHELISLGRQPRWYAAGWREESHEIPAGFIVDERLAQVAPDPYAPVVWTQGSKPRKDGSQLHPPRPHKHQSCRAETYRAACREGGFDIDPETVESCEKRHDPATYHRRVVLRFTHRELDEALAQMRSAAHLIRLHERGVLTPIRNPSPQRCSGCFARDICAEPTRDMAAAFFDFAPPKRARGTEAATT